MLLFASLIRSCSGDGPAAPGIAGLGGGGGVRADHCASHRAGTACDRPGGGRGAGRGRPACGRRPAAATRGSGSAGESWPGWWSSAGGCWRPGRRSGRGRGGHRPGRRRHPPGAGRAPVQVLRAPDRGAVRVRRDNHLLARDRALVRAPGGARAAGLVAGRLAGAAGAGWGCWWPASACWSRWSSTSCRRPTGSRTGGTRCPSWSGSCSSAAATDAARRRGGGRSALIARHRAGAPVRVGAGHFPVPRRYRSEPFPVRRRVAAAGSAPWRRCWRCWWGWGCIAVCGWGRTTVAAR